MSSTRNTPDFHIRSIKQGPEDEDFILAAFDASLPQLASIGSGGQWGSQPFSEREDTGARLPFQQAQRYQATGEGDPIYVFIIEAEVQDEDKLPASLDIRTDESGKRLVRVGTVMFLEALYPKIASELFDRDVVKKALDGTNDYIYVEALVTDVRVGELRKGAGVAMLDHARQFCRDKAKDKLHLIAYSGNDRKLVKYYESQGYSAVEDFVYTRPSGEKWPGAFMSLKLA
ncbi:acetyltransferase [Astrocystis sublimbata]|nr:acetyltransferase [Astrocystis sublimbata]